MRTAAMVLGIVGGVFGIISGLLAMLIGGIASVFEADGSGMVTGLGLAAIFIGVLGIIGGALANRSPLAAMIIQGIAAIAGFIAIFLFWSIAGPLLLAGAVLAGAAWWRARGTVPTQQAESGMTP